MAHYEPISRGAGRPSEDSTATRRHLFRSLSSKASTGYSMLGTTRPTAVDEHNELHRPARKLRRRPSATSNSSKASSSTAVGSEFRGVPPPIPLSDVALTFQSSTTSLVSSESGHYVKARKSLDAPRSSPFRGQSRRGISTVTPSNDASCQPMSTVLAADQLERRKAHMSKLMRHFGECRIPAELISSQPRPSMDTEKPPPLPKRLPKSRSLDLRPFASAFANAGTSEGPCPKPSLARTQSLGVQRRRNRGEPIRDPSNEGWDTELSRKVKRTRKITKIFGPEVARELTTMLEEIPVPARGFPHGVDDIEEDPAAESCRVSMDFDESTPSLMGDADDAEEVPSADPPSTPLPEDLGTDRQKRVHKLANFFGVDHLTVSSSIHVSSTTPPRVSPSTVPAAEPQPPLGTITEIDVQISGRRFWGISRLKGETKNAHMAEAIHQLRGLKAG